MKTRASAGTVRHETPAWMAALPGYRGYKEKELRREDDRILRQRVASLLRRHSDALRVILGTHFRYGPDDLLQVTDHLADRLRSLADAVSSSAYGYDGLFDRQAVREEELDRVREMDREMMRLAVAMEERVLGLSTAAANPRRYMHVWKELQGEAQALSGMLQHRADVLS